MTIPPEISSIVERLNRELDEIEQQAIAGQNLARIILDQGKRILSIRTPQSQ